jgi:hypothetical protein
VAHACGFQLDVPLYPTKEIFFAKLRRAMEDGANFELT